MKCYTYPKESHWIGLSPSLTGRPESLNMSVQARDIHAQSLATSSALSAYYIPHFIPPLDVFRVLNAVNVRFLLVGIHALGGWMREPRTTPAVDILVGLRLSRRVVRVLLASFPLLRAEEHDDQTRLRDAETGQVLIEVMKANQPLYRAAFRHGHAVNWENQDYQIPSLELALTMKFAAMISATRDYADKHFDAHDFLCMVQSNADIDQRKVHALGQLVYNGGGDEIVEKVRKVRAGEKLTL